MTKKSFNTWISIDLGSELSVGGSSEPIITRCLGANGADDWLWATRGGRVIVDEGTFRMGFDYYEDWVVGFDYDD